MHVRTEIRNSITSLFNTVFDGTIQIGGNPVTLYLHKLQDLSNPSIPAIRLNLMSETAAEQDSMYSTRECLMKIEVYVANAVTDEQTENDMDYLCEIIEQTMHHNRTNVGKVEDIVYQGFTRSTTPPSGTRESILTFIIRYNTTYPEPTTGANFNTANADISSTNIQIDMTPL